MSLKDKIMDEHDSEPFRKSLEDATLEEKVRHLWRLRCETFALANSLAGQERGAARLHELSNGIMRVFLANAEEDKAELNKIGAETMAAHIATYPPELQGIVKRIVEEDNL